MSLLVWLPLNGSLINFGLSDATFSINNQSTGISPTSTTGKIMPRAYARTTANTKEYITSSKNYILDKDFSMCCWCKVTGFANNNSANGIITNHSHETGGAGINIKVISDQAGNEDCRISCSTGFGSGYNTDITKTQRTFNYFYGTTNIFGEWHHLCLTYHKNTLTYNLYVDGKIEKVFQFRNNTEARPFNLFDWSTAYS
jgi:hypothetical protein